MSEDTATWHMIKYLPDVRRREPRNVGLVLATPNGWLTKFVGEAKDGAIKGNRVRGSIDIDVYKTWVDYFRRKANSQQWEDVERLQRRRRATYYSEIGGQVSNPDNQPWQSIINSLFNDLVQDQVDKTSTTTRNFLLSQAREVLTMANVQFQEKVEVDAVFDGKSSTVPFEFLHRDNKTHLMDAVNINGRDPQAKARELRARIVAARAAAASEDFFTFYLAGDHSERQIDEVLMPLEAESSAIDVTDVGNAADRVGELIRL